MCSHPGVLEGDYFLAIIHHHDGKINRYLLGEIPRKGLHLLFHFKHFTAEES